MNYTIEKLHTKLEVINLKIESNPADGKKTVTFDLNIENEAEGVLFQEFEMTQRENGTFDIQHSDTWTENRDDIEEMAGDDFFGIFETLNALALGLYMMTYEEELKEGSGGWLDATLIPYPYRQLHNQASIILEQNNGDWEDLKSEDLTIAPFWAEDGESIYPIHDIEDLINFIA